MALGEKELRKFVVQRRANPDEERVPIIWCDHWETLSLADAYKRLDLERPSLPLGWRLVQVIEDRPDQNRADAYEQIAELAWSIRGHADDGCNTRHLPDPHARSYSLFDTIRGLARHIIMLANTGKPIFPG
jgi:hypothetical protein